MKLTRILTILLLGVTAALVAGCASVNKQASNAYPEPSADKALIYFFREKKFAGAMLSYNVKHNDRVIGALANGTYFFYEVEPGTHTFTASTESTVSVTIEAQAGKTYYVAGGITFGIMAGRPVLSRANDSDAHALLPSVQYATKSAE